MNGASAMMVSISFRKYISKIAYFLLESSPCLGGGNGGSLGCCSRNDRAVTKFVNDIAGLDGDNTGLEDEVVHSLSSTHTQ